MSNKRRKKGQGTDRETEWSVAERSFPVHGDATVIIIVAKGK